MFRASSSPARIAGAAAAFKRYFTSQTGTPTSPATSSSPAAGSGPSRFWNHDVPSISLNQLKKDYGAARANDKRSRFRVREVLRQDGVISNFYPILYPQERVAALSEAPLYIYQIRATRSCSPLKEKSRKTVPEGEGDEGASVHPSAVWEAISRYFHHIYLNFPPLVRLNSKLYCAEPLMDKALQISKEYHDLGWDACEIELIEKTSFSLLPADELQQVINKIVPWCIRHSGVTHTAVVRESKGKFVSTELGLRANGVRVYKGVSVHALFIDTTSKSEVPQEASLLSQSSDGTVLTVVSSKDLSEAIPCGEGPVRFTVREFIRSFEYNGKTVESYKIEDASGVYLASLWEPLRAKFLAVGASYTVTGWKLKIYPERGNMRLYEFQRCCVFKEVPQKAKENHKTKSPVHGSRDKPEKTTSAFRGCISLKIDAKGTVASEMSLWEEVRQQFGPGPYKSSSAQERIRYAVEGTPVVSSTSMLQGVVRSVCFDINENTEEGRFARQFLSGDARRLLPKVEAHQPFALLQDGSLWPLQALHCCFDPRMKSWQDVTISTLSLLPEKRMRLLVKFQRILGTGLKAWGLELSEQPWRTKALSLLSSPHKNTERFIQRAVKHPFPRQHPSSVVVVGIAGEDEAGMKARVRGTCEQMARYFKTNFSSLVSTESEAVGYIVEQLMDVKSGKNQLRDKHSVAIIISPEKDSRAARWIHAECLSRGILPLSLGAPKSPRLQGMLCGNVKRRILTSFESDPLFGIHIYNEVPAIKGKYILFAGVDVCHTLSHSAGSVVGILCTPERNHLIPFFWHQESRGSEVENVAGAFHRVIKTAKGLYGQMDEIVVFQDGDVFHNVEDIKQELSLIHPDCGFSFMCLHKRGNIRFMHGKEYNESGSNMNNIAKGAVIQDLTPVAVSSDCTAAASFYLQSHDGNMSTSRIVHYTVHHISPTLPVSAIQQLANAMSNVMAPQPTKLPMPTRCAHRLADVAERLLDAVPQLQCELIPSPLSERLWFY